MGIQRGDQTTPATSSGPSDVLIQRYGQLDVLDDLIRLRARDFIQNPILAYPTSENDAASYTYYNGQDLDEMIDQVASLLISNGFQPVCFPKFALYTALTGFLEEKQYPER